MTTVKWWSKDTVAVVTGSNKSIGYEIVRGLAKNGVTTILTARDNGRGQKAVDALKAEGLDSVVFHQLDVNSGESINALAIWIKEKFGGLDILINNAGILLPQLSIQGAKATIDTNYYAVKNVTSALLPLLRPGARIVNVSSIAGQLCNYGDSKLAKVLGDEKDLSEELVDSYAMKYLEDVKADRWKEEGWSPAFPAYQDSKLLLNAYMRAFAKALSKRPGDRKVYLNAICPGYVSSDMNNHTGPRTAKEGAETAVWLALLPEEEYPHGGFWFDKKPLAY